MGSANVPMRRNLWLGAAFLFLVVIIGSPLGFEGGDSDQPPLAERTLWLLLPELGDERYDGLISPEARTPPEVSALENTYSYDEIAAQLRSSTSPELLLPALASAGQNFQFQERINLLLTLAESELARAESAGDPAARSHARAAAGTIFTVLMQVVPVAYEFEWSAAARGAVRSLLFAEQRETATAAARSAIEMRVAALSEVRAAPAREAAAVNALITHLREDLIKYGERGAWENLCRETQALLARCNGEVCLSLATCSEEGIVIERRHAGQEATAAGFVSSPGANSYKKRAPRARSLKTSRALRPKSKRRGSRDKARRRHAKKPSCPSSTPAPSGAPEASASSAPNDAVQRASSDLSLFFSEPREVQLSNYGEHPFPQPPPGYPRYYTASIDGTSLVAWGAVSITGGIRVSGIAQATDPIAAIALAAQELTFHSLGMEARLGSYLSTAPLTLSEEFVFSLLNELLDWSSTRTTFGTGAGGTFEAAFKRLALSESRIQYLLQRFIDGWPISAGSVGFYYGQLLRALLVRAEAIAQRQESYALLETPLRQFADHMLDHHLEATEYYARLVLLAAAEYHLYQKRKLRYPVFQQRNPARFAEALQAFLARYPAAADFDLARAAHKLSLFTDDQSFVTVSAEIFGRLVRSLSSNSQMIISNVAGIYEDTRVPLFNRLAPDVVDMILDAMEALQNDENYRIQYMIPLAALHVKGQLSPAQTSRVAALVNAVTERSIAELQQTDLPATAESSPVWISYFKKLSRTLELAKITGRRALADPLLAALNGRFAGNARIPAESEAVYAERMAEIQTLWHTHGVFAADLRRDLGRDRELTRILLRYFSVASKFTTPYFRLFFLNTSPPGTGSWAAATPDYWYDMVPISDWPMFRQSAHELTAHETGHIIHGGQDMAFDFEWGHLFERSIYELSATDFALPNGTYQQSTYKEDAADTFLAWFSRNPEFFSRALANAQNGRPVLMQKYLLWAGAVFAERDNLGREYFQMYRAINERTPYLGNPTAFEDTLVGHEMVNRMLIRHRDEKGRITEITDGQETYLFTYQGRDLVQATVNRPPVLGPIGNKSGREGQLLEFNVTVSDRENDTVDVSTSRLPPMADFRRGYAANTYVFSWRPDYAQAGQYPITFTARDGRHDSSESITITIADTNRPPVLQLIGNQTIHENRTLSFRIVASDPEGAPIRYSFSGMMPPGAWFSPVTGIFTWRPRFNAQGSYANLVFGASDGVSTTSERLTINVLDTIPAALDLDANAFVTTGEASAVSRYLFGANPAADATTISPYTCTRCTAAGIQMHLQSNRPRWDVDGNGSPDALSDGVLIIRYLQGQRGAALIAGAVPANCSRCSSAQIEQYLATLVVTAPPT